MSTVARYHALIAPLSLLMKKKNKVRVKRFLGTAYKISTAPTLGCAVFVLISIYVIKF